MTLRVGDYSHGGLGPSPWSPCPGQVAACLLLFLEEEDAFWMMCAIIEDLLPASYFSTTLLGVQTDQRVLRHFIVQYLPRLDKLLQEHDIGKDHPPFSLGSKGPETLTQVLRVQGLLTAEDGAAGRLGGVEKGVPHMAEPWAQHTQPPSLSSLMSRHLSPPSPWTRAGLLLLSGRHPPPPAQLVHLGCAPAQVVACWLSLVCPQSCP